VPPGNQATGIAEVNRHSCFSQAEEIFPEFLRAFNINSVSSSESSHHENLVRWTELRRRRIDRFDEEIREARSELVLR